MKKMLLLSALVLFVSVMSCKKDGQQESKTVPATPAVTERVVELSGEFYYDDQAAVLKGKNFIYGVQRDLMAEELAKRTTPKKRNKYDMIPVVIKGVVQPNPAIANGDEGWEEIVVIKEVITVKEPNDDETIKIESGS